MFDVGWSELLLIGVVALIVVGPKDLPHLFHSLGRFTAKARSMAREFSSAMEDAARESGVDDAANSLRDLKSLASKKSLGLDALDRAADRFEKWDPTLPAQRDGAKPDPGAPAAGSGPAPASTPAGTAFETAAAAADSTASDNRAQGRAAQTNAAQDDTGQDSTGRGDTAQGETRRRIHGVRRSDMKDR